MELIYNFAYTATDSIVDSVIREMNKHIPSMEIYRTNDACDGERNVKRMVVIVEKSISIQDIFNLGAFLGVIENAMHAKHAASTLPQFVLN